MDQKDLKLSKKLISSYKKRLEKEILDRSMKLKMPQNKFEEISFFDNFKSCWSKTLLKCNFILAEKKFLFALFQLSLWNEVIN